MANWQYKLELKDFYHRYPDELSLQDVADGVVQRIGLLLKEIREEPKNSRTPSIKNLYREDMLELADNLEYDILPLFEALVEEESEDVEDFDYAMEELYAWADTKLEPDWDGAKMCWIETF